MKKLLSILLLAALAAGATFADDMERDAMGLPLSKEPITLDMVRLSWPGVRGPASETWTWQRFAELSNITVNFEEWPISGFAETLQVRLAAEQLPDAFYQMIFNQDQLVSHSLAGNLIALDDLIAEHGPNIQAAFAADPSIEQALLMPDGKIHSLPYVAYKKNSAMVRFYVNETYLNNLGLEVPRTIDDLSDVLAAFKNDDANGNGDADDEYPIHQSGNATLIQRQAFFGAYGLGNRGLPGLGAHIDQGPDGTVRFIPTDERYREMLAQLNEWWEAGYYHPEFFSGVEIPVPTVAEGGTVGTEYRQTGVSLTFTPTVLDNDQISLTVQPRIREVAAGGANIFGAFVPNINERSAATTVELGDGESIAIAGLYRRATSSSNTGIPLLKDIPVWGGLFRTTRDTDRSVELIIVVTPRIVAAVGAQDTATLGGVARSLADGTRRLGNEFYY